jgi:hypothetical protein
MELDHPLFFQPASDLFRTPILLNIASDELFDVIRELDLTALGFCLWRCSARRLACLCRYPRCPVLRLISRESVLWERPSAFAIWFIEVPALRSISI